MKQIYTTFKKFTSTINENWYHGTPDSRQIVDSGFQKKKQSVTYT